jgi:hypothetical protein
MYDEVAKASIGECSSPRRASVVTQLERQRDEVKQRLSDIEAALKLFKENPILEQAFNSVAQLGIRC